MHWYTVEFINKEKFKEQKQIEAVNPGSAFAKCQRLHSGATMLKAWRESAHGKAYGITEYNALRAVVKSESTNMIPSTGIPKRIGAIYNRRPTTPWSEKEIRAYKNIAKFNPDLETEIGLIERYYVAEKKKVDKGIYRRDLLTLLNHWNGEVDRARAWAQLKFCKDTKRLTDSVQKSPYYADTSPSTKEDFQRASEIAKQCISDLRAKLSPQQA